MSHYFHDTWAQKVRPRLESAIGMIERAREEDCLAALERVPIAQEGFLALLSDEADKAAPKPEAAARALTEQRFGRVVNLYIPLYLSNECVNDCSYCWFGKSNPAPRKTLTLAETGKEMARLHEQGFRSLLLVAGEFRRKGDVEYIADCVRMAKDMGFVFLGLEARPFEVEEYHALGQAGLDSVTIYQETYDERIYAQVHPSGPKRNYIHRMNTPDRVAMAGIRSVGLGVLLGLGDFFRDAVALASHAKHMQKRHWGTNVSISFPRLHAAPGGFAAMSPVADNRFVRLITAMRLAFPDSTLTLSTREAPSMRDRLMGIGINQISAGSRTSPGAYTLEAGEEEQFPVVDERGLGQVIEALSSLGFERVLKDWDPNLKPGPMPEKA